MFSPEHSRVSVVFQRLLHKGSYPGGWRLYDVSHIPKTPASSFLQTNIQLNIHYTRCWSILCLFILDGLSNAEVCIHSPSVPIIKLLVYVMPYCTSLTFTKIIGEWARG